MIRAINTTREMPTMAIYWFPFKLLSSLFGIVLYLSIFIGIAFSKNAQTPKSALAVPPTVNSTYTVTHPTDGKMTVPKTFHLSEENGRLIRHEITTDQYATDDSVDLAKVSRVQVFASPPINPAKSVIAIDSFGSRRVIWEFRTEAEARALAEYLVSKASAPLELIAGVWRVRKSFRCPQGSYPGCDGFMQLLDNENPAIVAWFYHSEQPQPYHDHVNACFSDSEHNFFILYYGDGGTFGVLRQEIYRDGQLYRANVGYIQSVGTGAGRITRDMFLLKPSQKEKIKGSINPTDLSFDTKFSDKTNATTEYTVTVELSTGQYKEHLSGKGDSTGRCVKLP